MPSIIYTVIANWNGKKPLQKCLTSLLANTMSSECRVVVVDNASIDGSIEMVKEKFQNVELIKNPENTGYSRANNQGIRHALANDAKYVLLLNNDIEITDGKWLQTLTNAFNSDSRISIVGCKLLYPNGKIQHAGGIINLSGGCNRGECELDTGKYDKAEFVDFVTGAALMIRSEVIDRIGLLDEGFSPIYYEDADWCLRARLYGYKVAYTPQPTLIHNCGSSANKLKPERKKLYLRKSFVRFFLLNFQFKDIVKRILIFESRILVGCFFTKTQNKRLPLTLRSDTPSRLLLFVEAWLPSIYDLRNILSLRQERFKFKLKLSIESSFV